MGCLAVAVVVIVEVVGLKNEPERRTKEIQAGPYVDLLVTVRGPPPSELASLNRQSLQRLDRPSHNEDEFDNSVIRMGRFNLPAR